MHRAIPVVVLSAAMILSSSLQAQSPSGLITGRVIDSATRKPIEFARVAVYSRLDSSIVTGGVSGADGSFSVENLPQGDFYAEIVFLGYEPGIVSPVRISSPNASVTLGTISLASSALEHGEVIVEGERRSVQYRIDRKVLDARAWSTTASGTAVEILEQIPSVTVDIEGNVSLRGSGSFTVLIDGKPSVLDPQDALQQIPSSSIASIEVITNPSAKFDPEGTAGVINIVLAKRQAAGLSGTFTANAGANDTYGGDGLINYRANGVESVVSIDHNNRTRPGSRQSNTTFTERDSADGIQSIGSSANARLSSGLRGAVTFSAWENGTIGLRGRYGEREWSNHVLQSHETFTGSSIISAQTNRSDRRRGGTGFDLTMDVEHVYGENDHKLTGDISYGVRNGDELTLSEIRSAGVVTEGRRTTERGPSDEIEARINYERPLGTQGRLEMGYQGEIDRDNEETGVSEYDLTLGTYARNPLFDRDVVSLEQEHALYAVYGDMLGALGYQAGFRVEVTDRSIELASIGQRFDVKEWDTFPTLHLSYRLPDGQQLMASYSRRIDRPRGWQLEPFLTYIDATTVRTGNPSLLPEYIDSYEIGMQSFFLGFPLNAEVYYRATTNRVESIRSVYADNVMLHTFENVGADGSLGVETMASLNPWAWMDVQLIGNLYRYTIDAVVQGSPLSRTSTQWGVRMNGLFKITSTTKFQANLRYNSAEVSAQEREEAYISGDIGLRQDLLANRLALMLQVRDVFGSVRREETTTAIDFIRREIQRRDGPTVMFQIRLNLGGTPHEEEMIGGDDEGGFEE